MPLRCRPVRDGSDISAGTGKCNCSICTKTRLWSVEARSEAFRLVAGENDLTDYRGKNPVAHHFFCKHCGVSGFERVDMPNMTGAIYFNLNIACLDGVDVDELMAAPVIYRDGRNDTRRGFQGPLLDHIDLRIEVPAVSAVDLIRPTRQSRVRRWQPVLRVQERSSGSGSNVSAARR